jgi:hypothetical protein
LARRSFAVINTARFQALALSAGDNSPNGGKERALDAPAGLSVREAADCCDEGV